MVVVGGGEGWGGGGGEQECIKIWVRTNRITTLDMETAGKCAWPQFRVLMVYNMAPMVCFLGNMTVIVVVAMATKGEWYDPRRPSCRCVRDSFPPSLRQV